MLRRDACWPAASEDASWLLHPKYQDDVDPDTTNPMVEVNREVTLMTSNLSPTTDRWRSFGWRVTKTEKL
jgi:hypothetical protein